MNAYLITNEAGIESRIEDNGADSLAVAMRLWTVISHGTLSYYDAATNRVELWASR